MLKQLTYLILVLRNPLWNFTIKSFYPKQELFHYSFNIPALVMQTGNHKKAIE